MTGYKQNKRGPGNGAGARSTTNGKGKSTAAPRARKVISRSPAVPRGGPVKKNPMGGTNVSSKAGLDAFSNAHLSLPRPVSSYTTMRVTRRIGQMDAKGMIFSPFNFQKISSSTGDHGNWSNQVGLYASDASKQSNASDCWKSIVLPTNDANWQRKTVVPSAISVRVYNPHNMQTTEGMVYMGRISGEMNWDNATDTVSDLFANLLNYQAPIALTAPELALKPRQIDAVPLDFSAISDFTDFKNNLPDDAAYAWTNADAERPGGFTPIFVWNPNQVKLTIEVCVEFRVRFDPTSPYSVTQKHYAPSPIGTWDRLMREACQANSNGVRAVTSHR